MRPIVALAALLAALGASAPASAGRFAAAFGVEAWPDETVPLHGILLVAYDFEPMWAGARPAVVFNTDTVRLTVRDLRLGEAWRLGLGLAGEYGVAGLLTDYYVDGEAIAERGFLASYAEAEVRLERRFGGGGWAELVAAGRRWFFDRSDDTAAELALPPEAFVFMPRLHLGVWRLDDDAGWRERHRLFPRLRGWAAGVDLGLDLRSDGSDWGALGAEDARRNRPEAAIVTARQWARFGLPLGRARVEVEQRAGWGRGEDDLTRARVGGMNPYVVAVPGAPWAAWLADRFVGGGLTLPVRVGDDVEVGPTAAAVWLDDPRRRGLDEMGAVWGAGAVLDARWGRWQLDLRGGLCPSLDGPAWSAYLGLGWGG